MITTGNKQKTDNKMADLIANILFVLHSLKLKQFKYISPMIEIDRVDLKKTQPTYMLFTRNSLQTQ